MLVNRYGQTRERTAATIADLLALPGAVIVDAVEWPRGPSLWPEPSRDLTDAVLAAACRTGRHGSVATFDERFRKLWVRQELHSYW